MNLRSKLYRAVGRTDPRTLIDQQERMVNAWQLHAEGLRLALVEERRNHARTLRLLEEATAALKAPADRPRPEMCSSLAECTRTRSAASRSFVVAEGPVALDREALDG